MNDDFAQDTALFLERSGQTDTDGNRLVATTQSNGRFHSDWLSMMYGRLKLARNLLADDGVIFIYLDNKNPPNRWSSSKSKYQHHHRPWVGLDFGS